VVSSSPGSPRLKYNWVATQDGTLQSLHSPIVNQIGMDTKREVG
jgi:hypothetical protein